MSPAKGLSSVPRLKRGPAQPASTSGWPLLVTKCTFRARLPPPPANRVLIPLQGLPALLQAHEPLQPVLFACRVRELGDREQYAQAELERQEHEELLFARERLAFQRRLLERERMERERLERKRMRVELLRRRQQDLHYEQERRPYDDGR